MPWTEESIIAEFRTHIVYWQEKLRLRDVIFNVRVRDHISDDPDAWCSVKRENCGSNPYAVDFQIRRNSWIEQTRYDVWETTAHECVHVMNWAMSYAFQALDDHFSVSQMSMAKALMKVGNEELAYKWEAILTGWFASDAPPKEIPE